VKHNSSPFKWRHYEPEIILLCVRWYLRYQLSYRDVEEMMRERGLTVDHTSIYRRVQEYAPEINKHPVNISWIPEPHGVISHILIHYLKAALPMRTTSLVSTPRMKASERPSRDQSKAMICSALKSVSCFGGLPSSGWSQISERPPVLLA